RRTRTGKIIAVQRIESVGLVGIELLAEVHREIPLRWYPSGRDAPHRRDGRDTEIQSPLNALDPQDVAPVGEIAVQDVVSRDFRRRRDAGLHQLAEPV